MAQAAKKGKSIVNCPSCQGRVKSNGHFENRNRSVQRFLCVNPDCGKSFSESQPLDGIRIDTEEACRVVEMLVEGIGIRAAARLARVNPRTVLRILEAAGERCIDFLDARMRNLQVRDVQIDELYSFVHCLERNRKPMDSTTGEQYCFLAIERNSKAILDWHIGKRTRETTALFLNGLKERIDGRFQITSDGFHPYCLPNTGLVKQVFGEQVDYGLEIKIYAPERPGVASQNNPVICKAIQRKKVYGSPDFQRMTTNHAERTNLTVRLFNRRFTRKTMGFSRKLQNHIWAVALFVASFNFCHKHSGIGGNTPAMAQGIATHAFTMAEILTATI